MCQGRVVAEEASREASGDTEGMLALRNSNPLRWRRLLGALAAGGGSERGWQIVRPTERARMRDDGDPDGQAHRVGCRQSSVELL